MVILDVSGLSGVTDYFVIASADNRVQLRAMADETKDRLLKQGIRARHIEGYDETGWVLMDCGDVVIHYFLEERREFYGLERLWGDAPRLELSDSTVEGRGDER